MKGIAVIDDSTENQHLSLQRLSVLCHLLAFFLSIIIATQQFFQEKAVIFIVTGYQPSDTQAVTACDKLVNIMEHLFAQI